MPRGLSSTCLPASKVLGAARGSYGQLLVERNASKHTCEQDWIRTFRERHFWRGMWTKTADILRVMPEYHKLWKEYRTDDERVLIALIQLCEAALAFNSDFTITMTADDFRLIGAGYVANEEKRS